MPLHLSPIFSIQRWQALVFVSTHSNVDHLYDPSTLFFCRWLCTPSIIFLLAFLFHSSFSTYYWINIFWFSLVVFLQEILIYIKQYCIKWQESSHHEILKQFVYCPVLSLKIKSMSFNHHINDNKKCTFVVHNLLWSCMELIVVQQPLNPLNFRLMWKNSVFVHGITIWKYKSDKLLHTSSLIQWYCFFSILQVFLYFFYTFFILSS